MAGFVRCYLSPIFTAFLLDTDKIVSVNTATAAVVIMHTNVYAAIKMQTDKPVAPSSVV